jgi:hypothetical protein
MQTNAHARVFASSLAIVAAAMLWGQGVVADGIRIATKLNLPGPIRLDSGGTHLLFGQVNQSPCSGELDAVAADGGSISQISSNAAIFESGFCRGISQMVFSGSNVLFGYGGYGDYNLDVAPGPCGAACKHLLTALTGGIFLGVFNGNAYYSANFTDIDTIPISGGNSTLLNSGYFVRSMMLDTVAKNNWISGLHFVDYNSSSVFQLNLNTNQATTIIKSTPDEGFILTDSQRVFWWDGNQIIASKKTENCLYPCSKLYSGKVTSIGVDESELDNSKGNIFFGDGANLWRLPKSGGAQIIYAGKNIQFVQTDGAAVYFLDRGALKLLPTNAMDGIAPLTLASSAAISYSTLNDGLYWADDADGSPGAGKIYYLVQQASQLDALQYSTTDAANKLYSCSCKAATFALLARTVLLSHGQDVAASGVKIDYFFDTNGSQEPCSDKNAPGATWAANGRWKNPVYSDVVLSGVQKIGTVDVASLLKSGPVFLGRSDSDLHWMLATNVAKVLHGHDNVSGIAAYDPLSGSKVLLQGQSGSYQIAFVLDPKTNLWCTFSECSLVDDINNAALQYGHVKKFTSEDLSFLQQFKPSNYQTANVKS